ncbi:antA/AntB antirepressor family protein [Orbaceae bacterium ESL0727]|nr:antA/AntB antirepressor family protein [Orbaceae bacterium ESL0727]
MTKFNELVPITEVQINGKPQQTVSAKQLHTYLDVGRDFSTWFNSRIKQYGFIQGEDYITEKVASKLRKLNSDQHYPNDNNQSTNNKQYSPNPGKNTRRGRPEKDYFLTLNMAKELAMIENNEKGHAIRRHFIRCEEQLRNIAPIIHKSELKRLKARLEAASYSRPMCDALTMSRLAQGKETKPHHYKNEYDMLNSIILGVPAKAYRLAHGIKGDIRNHFSEQQISHLAYLERSNITLLDVGWDYQQRKTELTKLSQTYLTRLMNEVTQ